MVALLVGFFMQAEDGIRGRTVTGVQTCALPIFGEPYHQEEAGTYAKLAKACSLGGAALIGTAGRRSRFAAVAGGALLLAGEAALRWSVFKAGFQSARDPKYTVAPQRERVGYR